MAKSQLLKQTQLSAAQGGTLDYSQYYINYKIKSL